MWGLYSFTRCCDIIYTHLHQKKIITKSSIDYMTGFALMSMFLNSRFMLEPDTVNPDLRKFYE
jgi:hypothetical protein